jgi:hypothetical protein
MLKLGVITVPPPPPPPPPAPLGGVEPPPPLSNFVDAIFLTFNKPALIAKPAAAIPNPGPITGIAAKDE